MWWKIVFRTRRQKFLEKWQRNSFWAASRASEDTSGRAMGGESDLAKWYALVMGLPCLTVLSQRQSILITHGSGRAIFHIRKRIPVENVEKRPKAQACEWKESLSRKVTIVVDKAWQEFIVSTELEPWKAVTLRGSIGAPTALVPQIGWACWKQNKVPTEAFFSTEVVLEELSVIRTEELVSAKLERVVVSISRCRRYLQMPRDAWLERITRMREGVLEKKSRASSNKASQYNSRTVIELPSPQRRADLVIRVTGKIGEMGFDLGIGCPLISVAGFSIIRILHHPHLKTSTPNSNYN